MKVALYLRISTSEERQNFAVQEEPLRELCAARGWEVAAVFKDEASGAKDRRPSLDELKREAARGKFKAVLVWRFDRFARSTRHLVESLEQFRAQGVDFLSYSENIDTTTPQGKMVFSIMAAVAEFERELIRERVRAGLARSGKKGRKKGARNKKTREKTMEARRLLGAGVSLRKAAAAVGLSVNTLRSLP